MPTPVLLITSPYLAGSSLFSEGYDVRTLINADVGTQEAFFAGAGQEVEVLVTGGEPLTGAFMARLPRLRLVACLTTGYEAIDYRWIRANGVTLTTAAGQNAHDVADHAVALVLGLRHRLVDAHRVVMDGGWRDQIDLRHSLRGAKAGIVGLGRIGLAVAERLRPLQIDIRWWGPREKPEAPYPRSDTLMDLASWADLLIVTGRSTQENGRLIDRSILRALGAKGMLINVARGQLVDEPALIEALRDGTLGGAGLDVLEQEPPAPGVWRDVPNVLLTPHTAGATQEALQGMMWQAQENVRRYFAGLPLLSPVDDPV